ncbi:hypothetical protein RJD39_04665 [Vibrio scophthalmi]|uniref:hypothetical protein n=1 Tax=Vibrio scophthalmi TaxID=45658 RepID=UPI003873C9E2
MKFKLKFTTGGCKDAELLAVPRIGEKIEGNKVKCVDYHISNECVATITIDDAPNHCLLNKPKRTVTLTL